MNTCADKFSQYSFYFNFFSLHPSKHNLSIILQLSFKICLLKWICFLFWQSSELHIYTDFLRIVLEILNVILTYALPRNPEVSSHCFVLATALLYLNKNYLVFMVVLDNIYIGLGCLCDVTAAGDISAFQVSPTL